MQRNIVGAACPPDQAVREAVGANALRAGEPSPVYLADLRHHATQRFFIAYTVGATIGGLAFGIEVAVGHSTFTWSAAAFYSLLGGAVAAISRSALATLLSASVSRLAAAVVISGFAVLHLLYFANVKLLSGEHFLSTTSLGVDLLVLLAVAVPAVMLARSHRVHEFRLRVGSASAGLGIALLLAASAVLARTWPASPTDASRNGRGPNLLLVVMDSVRRDRFGDGSLRHPTTPTLFGLAQSGRIYPEAWSPSSWTVPSVARLLGTEDTAPASLAERLARHGYATACFTDNPHLWSGSPQMRGFDRVERSVRRWRVLLHGTVADEVLDRLMPGDDRRLVDKANAWASHQRGPFFLYVHLMDSHTPYRFPPIDGKRRPGRRVEFPGSGMRLTALEAEDIVARYDGGVLSADTQVGRLISTIRASQRPFLAVVTADHGESLGEAGRWFHGQSLSPELLAVPLVLVGEAVVAGRVDSPVSNGAILPTMLATAGIPCPECRRQDLRSGRPSDVVEGGLPPDLAYRIVGRYKLVVNLKTGRQQLFDRLFDPTEERDIAGENTGIVEALSTGVKALEHTQPTPESIERLRSLGYTGP